MRRENVRRWANLVACYACWGLCISLAAWVSFWNVAPTTRWPTFFIIIGMGLGITCSLVRSRYKLTDTISEVFRAGYKAGWNASEIEKTTTPGSTETPRHR